MKQVDWQQIVKDLVKSGMTQAQIGEACGVTQAAVNLVNIGVTKDPKYSFGEKLLVLHAQVLVEA